MIETSSTFQPASSERYIDRSHLAGADLSWHLNVSLCPYPFVALQPARREG